MRLTRFGFNSLLFYLAMVGAFLASPYSNLFFLLLAFLTLLLSAAVVSTWLNMRSVSATLPDVPPTPAGAGQYLRATVSAPSRTRFQVSVELELEGGRTASGNAGVVSGEAQLQVRLPALPRGMHAVRRARVSSSYPLGMIVVGRPIEAPAECIVYPVPAELASVRSSAEALSELLGTSASGRGDLQPSSLRDFRTGDESRAVHWRASARRGTLVVKEWEGGGGEGLEVCLDRRCESEPLESSLSIISALIEVARTNKEVLALSSQGLRATFGEGHRPWREALRFLALAQALPATDPPPPAVSPAVTRLPMSARAGEAREAERAR